MCTDEISGLNILFAQRITLTGLCAPVAQQNEDMNFDVAAALEVAADSLLADIIQAFKADPTPEALAKSGAQPLIFPLFFPPFLLLRDALLGISCSRATLCAILCAGTPQMQV